MIRDEDDILAETLAAVVRWFDRILVLDGTVDEERRARTDEILGRFPEVVWHGRDEDFFTGPVTDGARQVLLVEARERYGLDQWIGVLHADEFLDQDPRPMLAARHPALDPSVRVRVAHTFLHPDDRHRWDGSAPGSVRSAVRHLMWPGVPEARFFFDDGSRSFDPTHHSKVVPRSLRNGPLVDGYVITQYNERNPERLLERARQRVASGWQAGHYRRLLETPPRVFVPTLDLEDAPFVPEFAGDPEGPYGASGVFDHPWGPLEGCEPVIRVVMRDEEAAVGELAGPDGLAALIDRPSPRRAARWAARARCRTLRPGDDALIRYTAGLVGSRRLSVAQRRVVVGEYVCRMGVRTGALEEPAITMLSRDLDALEAAVGSGMKGLDTMQSMQSHHER